MSSYSTELCNLAVKNLFATPLVISELPPEMIADLNPKLKALVLEKAECSESVYASNYGGWQSDDKILEWGGDAVATLIACIRQLIGKITLYHDGVTFQRGEEIVWRINGWANVNRKHHANVPHVHPGAYWSAVYYVATDKVDGNEGGEIELFDPRGCLPLMYCPALRIGLQGYTTAGNAELHKPKEGQCIVFPAWLSHAVRSYTGDNLRISLAFNFSV